MGSGSSVPAFQLTTEEAAGVDAFVAAGVAEVPSLARRVEELQAGAQESERLIEGVAQEQLQEEVRSLRRRVEELQEEVAQLKEEAGAEEAERLLDEAQTQLLEEAAVETALAQVAGRRVEELQAGSHDSEKLQEEVRSLRQAEAAAARRIEELERLREVCSLHQAETAATQRIQELDSYLREEAKGVEQVLGSAGGGTSSSAELATEAKRERNEVIVRIKARWESQKLKHILEIQEQQFGKEDRDTLNTKIDLAAALQLQNDFTGAQKQLEEVFEALGRAQSADLKPQLEEVSEALGRAGPTDLKDELHGCCETSACAHPTTRKDDPITRRAVDCFASLLGCLHEDKETMLKEVSKMQSQKLGEEHPLTVNSKADLAVVLQERDEQKEAAQVLKEILQEPHGHDVGIDFLKDLTLSPGPAAAAKDSAIDDKKKFTLHFVAKERAHANTEETSDIKYEGKIRSGASACWISFPGKFAAGWDALVAELHGDSVACVFLSTPDSGLGWHHKFADGSCYCKHIYGERDFETFGYLVKMKDRDSEKLKREQAKAKLTHAVVVAADATDKEEEKCRQEAERRWKENGKTAAWGCQWFHAWKEKAKRLTGVLQPILPSQRRFATSLRQRLRWRQHCLLEAQSSSTACFEKDFFSLGRSRRKRNPKETGKQLENALNQPNQDADPWQSEDEENCEKHHLTRKALRFKDIAARPQQAAPAMLGGAWPVTSRIARSKSLIRLHLHERAQRFEASAQSHR